MIEGIYDVYEVHLSNVIGMMLFMDQRLAAECCQEHNDLEVVVATLFKDEAYLTRYDLDEINVNGYVWR